MTSASQPFLSPNQLRGTPPDVRVLLIDLHENARRGARQLLEAIGTFKVVGDTGDVTEALSLAEHYEPALVLMGMRVRGSSGIDMTRRLKRLYPELHVVMLTLFDSPEYVQECARAGASGYVLKEAPVEQLLKAIDTVFRGGTYTTPGLPALDRNLP